MLENKQNIYADAKPILDNCGFDLEGFIGELEKDIKSDNIFLKKYIRNKIKLDFMQALYEIVKSSIKNVYAEKNEGIFLLLKNFSNFFTLNYDPFLYLLLLKYKPINNKDNNAFAFQSTLKFIEEDLDAVQNNIYKEIKGARESGKLRINFNDNDSPLVRDFNKLTKTHFTAEVKEYSKINKKGWKGKDINRVVKTIFEEEKRKLFLSKIDDGSRQLNLFGGQSEFIFEDRDTQNLFFLHGAFHIYKDGNRYKKITQESDKALYDKLEEILNSDEKDIVCVFQSENKMSVIQENKYLKNCHNKLSTLSGNMVIIGSSLADNDNHIFEQINKSNIKKVFISSLKNGVEKNMEFAKRKFPEKEIFFFDAQTISYESPKELNKDDQTNRK